MPLKSHQEPLPDMNLTPMIDVVFNLIIFFMVGTKFAEMDRAVELKVPRVASVKNLSAIPARRVIEVYRDGTIRMGAETVPLDRLTQRLQQEVETSTDLGVTVRGDAEGAFQNVANVLTACRDAGLSDLAISVELNSKRR